MKDALTIRSESISRIAIVVLAVTATLNLAWVVTTYVQLHEHLRAAIAAGGSSPLLSESMIRRDWMIAAALIIAALSLASKRGFGLMLSLIALLWVLFEYFRWYFWTQRLIETLGMPGIPPWIPQGAHLWGGTTWSVAVLIICAILVVWEMAILIRILRSSQRAVGSASSDR
jgi:hypothetical protein